MKETGNRRRRKEWYHMRGEGKGKEEEGGVKKRLRRGSERG